MKNKSTVPDVMVIDGKHMLCHVSKQAVGDTEDLYTDSIGNTLTKYTASKETVI